jgi:hypothetical protein
MGMVRSRFSTLPEAFNMSLVPPAMPKEKKGMLPSFLEKKIFKVKIGHFIFELPEGDLFSLCKLYFFSNDSLFSEIR